MKMKLALLAVLLGLAGCNPARPPEPNFTTRAQKVVYDGCMLGVAQEQTFKGLPADFGKDVVPQLCACVALNPLVQQQLTEYTNFVVINKDKLEYAKSQKMLTEQEVKLHMVVRQAGINCMSAKPTN